MSRDGGDRKEFIILRLEGKRRYGGNSFFVFRESRERKCVWGVDWRDEVGEKRKDGFYKFL